MPAGEQSQRHALFRVQQARITFQLISEGIQGLQTFLRLPDEVLVGFKNFETEWIVDMSERDALLFQRFAEKHVLVAVFPETFIERMLYHDIAVNQEVGGVEVLIGMLLAVLYRVPSGGRSLIDGSQVPGVAAPDLYASDDDLFVLVCQGVALQEILSAHNHVAVYEQKPLVVCFPCQKVADTCPSDVLSALYVAAARPSVHGSVFLHDLAVGRTVVSHDNLIAYSQFLCLSVQVAHQCRTGVVEGWNQDGQFFHHCAKLMKKSYYLPLFP